MKQSLSINNKSIDINSLLLAICISSNMLVVTTNEFISINIGIIFILIFLISVKINKFRYIKYNIEILFLVIFIFIFFLIGIMMERDKQFLYSYLISFIVFGVISMFITLQKINFMSVMRYVIYIYLCLSWYMLTININGLLPGNKMGLGYNIIIPVIISIYLLFNDKCNKKSKIIYFFTLIYYMYFTLIIASRGPILSLAIFCFFQILKKTKRIHNKIFCIIVFFILTILISRNLLYIMDGIREFLNSLNIESSFVDHTIHQIKISNLSNGRGSLISRAISEFSENPIIGSGIGNFTSVYGSYVHNFIFQLLDEGGLVLTMPILLIIMNSFFKIISYKSNEIKLDFLLIIFCLVIPKLCFSSVYWEEQMFWVLIAMTISLNKNYRIRSEDYVI